MRHWLGGSSRWDWAHTGQVRRQIVDLEAAQTVLQEPSLTEHGTNLEVSTMPLLDVQAPLAHHVGDFLLVKAGRALLRAGTAQDTATRSGHTGEHGQKQSKAGHIEGE